MLERIRPYIAPRYWFSALGIILILLGLTGGTNVAGYDVTITGDVYRIASILLGVISLLGGFQIHRKFMKAQNGD